jgi:hypothetical protein
VNSRVLKYNNLYTWRWPFRPKHVVKWCLIREQWMILHTDGTETPCTQMAQKPLSQIAIQIQCQSLISKENTLKLAETHWCHEDEPLPVAKFISWKGSYFTDGTIPLLTVTAVRRLLDSEQQNRAFCFKLYCLTRAEPHAVQIKFSIQSAQSALYSTHLYHLNSPCLTNSEMLSLKSVVQLVWMDCLDPPSPVLQHYIS